MLLGSELDLKLDWLKWPNSSVFGNNNKKIMQLVRCEALFFFFFSPKTELFRDLLKFHYLLRGDRVQL